MQRPGHLKDTQQRPEGSQEPAPWRPQEARVAGRGHNKHEGSEPGGFANQKEEQNERRSTGQLGWASLEGPCSFTRVGWGTFRTQNIP
jgi:hypothetical protein